MFRKEKFLNPHLHKLEVNRIQTMLRRNIENIKKRKFVTESPFEYTPQEKARRIQNRGMVNLLRITHDNVKISRKIYETMTSTKGDDCVGTGSPPNHGKLIAYEKIRDNSNKRNYMKVTIENLELLKRLKESKSVYKKSKLLSKEFNRIEELTRICEFPLIIETPSPEMTKQLQSKLVSDQKWSIHKNSKLKITLKKNNLVRKRMNKNMRLVKSAEKNRSKKLYKRTTYVSKDNNRVPNSFQKLKANKSVCNTQYISSKVKENVPQNKNLSKNTKQKKRFKNKIVPEKGYSKSSKVIYHDVRQINPSPKNKKKKIRRGKKETKNYLKLPKIHENSTKLSKFGSDLKQTRKSTGLQIIIVNNDTKTDLLNSRISVDSIKKLNPENIFKLDDSSERLATSSCYTTDQQNLGDKKKEDFNEFEINKE